MPIPTASRLNQTTLPRSDGLFVLSALVAAEESVGVDQGVHPHFRLPHHWLGPLSRVVPSGRLKKNGPILDISVPILSPFLRLVEWGRKE